MNKTFDFRKIDKDIKLKANTLKLANTRVLNSMTVGEYKKILKAQTAVDEAVFELVPLFMNEKLHVNIEELLPRWRSFQAVDNGSDFKNGEITVTEYLHDERSPKSKVREWIIQKSDIISAYSK